jgi:hypothetical protein
MHRILLYRLLNKLRHGWAAGTLYCYAHEMDILCRKLPDLIKGVPAQTYPPCAVSVHMLLSRESLVMGLWAARSFQHFTGRCWKMVFHDDGSLGDADAALLERHFPLGRVWRRADADRQVEAGLAGYPGCLENRRRQIMFLKLFDPYFGGAGDRFILLDSDVLFFQTPKEILEWAESDAPGFGFNSDVHNAYSVETDKLESHFGVPLWKNVNAGLALVPRAGISLETVESYLQEFSSQSVHDLWLEQTAYALLASKYGRGELLPSSYEISFNPKRGAHCVARHYVTAAESRQHFFREGVVTLAPVLLR